MLKDETFLTAPSIGFVMRRQRVIWKEDGKRHQTMVADANDLRQVLYDLDARRVPKKDIRVEEFAWFPYERPGWGNPRGRRPKA